MNFDSSYEIKYDRKFESWVKKNFPRHLKSILDAKLRYFTENPRHPSLNTKPYGGISTQTLKRLCIDEVYEFYVNQKKYRCLVYVIHETKELIIAFIGTHDQLRNFIKNK